MTKEQLDQLLDAVEERVNKALEPVIKERDALAKRLDEVEGKFGEEGELTKKLAELSESGDQTLREIIVGTEDKPGLVKRLGDIEAQLTTRKSVTSQDEVVVGKSVDDPLVAAMKKAIKHRGEPVVLTNARAAAAE